MSSDCIHKQPSASMCIVCGRDNPIGLHMAFYDNDKDTVIGRCTPDERYQGYPGIMHGGILATMLDEVVGRVSMVGDHHHFMMTVNLTVKYRHPVEVNTPLIAVGKAVRMRGRIGKAEGKIILPDGTVACEAELTLADMPNEIATQSRINSLDWKIDPD